LHFFPPTGGRPAIAYRDVLFSVLFFFLPRIARGFTPLRFSRSFSLVRFDALGWASLSLYFPPRHLGRFFSPLVFFSIFFFFVFGGSPEKRSSPVHSPLFVFFSLHCSNTAAVTLFFYFLFLVYLLKVLIVFNCVGPPPRLDWTRFFAIHCSALPLLYFRRIRREKLTFLSAFPPTF